MVRPVAINQVGELGSIDRPTLMIKEISSSTTVAWKYVFPGVWILFMGIVGAIVAGFQATWKRTMVLFVLGWIIASGFLIWFARRLKFVSIDEDFLYVSDFRKEIQVPLAQIESVKENFWPRPKLITLTLDRPTEFGKEIVFVPPPLVFAALRSHPLVEEIEGAVQRSRSAISSSR